MSIWSWPEWLMKQPTRMARVMRRHELPMKPLHICWVDADSRRTYDVRTLRGRTSMWAEEAAALLANSRLVLMNAGALQTSTPEPAIKPGFRFWRSDLHRRMTREATILRRSWRKEGYGDIVIVYLVDLDGKRGWHSSRSGFILMDTGSGRGSTLAHEIGHYADLMHRQDPTNLMKTGTRTANRLTRFQQRMINTAVRGAPIMERAAPATTNPEAAQEFRALIDRIGTVDSELPWHDPAHA